MRYGQVEGRLLKGKFRNLKVGDVVTWEALGNPRTYRTTITAMRTYESFEEMLTEEKLENVLPTVDSLVEGVNTTLKNNKKSLKF